VDVDGVQLKNCIHHRATETPRKANPKAKPEHTEVSETTEGAAGAVLSVFIGVYRWLKFA
jgi:hypothetical protein